MKRKKILILVLLLLCLFVGYKYVYQSHRDISTENSSYATTTSAILNEYNNNEQAANKKYLDKTITVTGLISEIDAATNNINIDGKLTCKLNEINNLKINDSISIKGRFIGYDELLEEIKMDQISINK